jgi:hypothetical protein
MNIVFEPEVGESCKAVVLEMLHTAFAISGPAKVTSVINGMKITIEVLDEPDE